MMREAVALARRWTSLSLDPAGLRALRDKKVRRAVRAAYAGVPYYRELLDGAGVSPESIQGVDDLERIPITSRADLAAAGHARLLRVGTDPKDCLRVHTSGSSGEPLGVYLDRADLALRRALHFRSLLVAGFRRHDRLVHLGQTSNSAATLAHRLGLWPRDYISPLLTVREQVEQLRALQPDVLWSSPTRLRAVLEETSDRLSRICRPRLLITSGERLDEAFADGLRADGALDVFNFYGSVEVGRVAWECRAHAGLHVNADVVHLELLPSEATDAGRPLGETVVTPLEPGAMPLLRYRLGDLSAWESRERCACGSWFPRIRPPVGRRTEVARLPSGAVFAASGFQNVLRGYDSLRRFRVVQLERGRFEVLLVPRRPDARPPLGEIEKSIADFLGEPVRIEVRVVAEITSRGAKYTDFESRVSGAAA